MTYDEFYARCRECALTVHGGRAPTPAYGLTVARFLFTTGLHESGGLQHTRQVGFSWADGRGAHGFMQLEHIAVIDSLRRIRERPMIATTAALFLFDDDRAANWLAKLYAGDAISMVCGWHELGILLARVLMFRVPAAIPESPRAQAYYWGRYYNTRNEEMKNAQWLRRYHDEAAPVILRAGDAAPT